MPPRNRKGLSPRTARVWTYPAFCLPDSELPWNRVFYDLRERWLQSDLGRTSAELAEILGVTVQRISVWATGSTNRKPPFWAVMALCHLTGTHLEITPTDVRILG